MKAIFWNVETIYTNKETGEVVELTPDEKLFTAIYETRSQYRMNKKTSVAKEVVIRTQKEWMALYKEIDNSSCEVTII